VFGAHKLRLHIKNQPLEPLAKLLVHAEFFILRGNKS